MRPSAKTGDAEKLLPSRCCQWTVPVRASRQEAIPLSVTT